MRNLMIRGTGAERVKAELNDGITSLLYSRRGIVEFSNTGVTGTVGEADVDNKAGERDYRAAIRRVVSRVVTPSSIRSDLSST